MQTNLVCIHVIRCRVIWSKCDSHLFKFQESFLDSNSAKIFELIVFAFLEESDLCHCSTSYISPLVLIPSLCSSPVSVTWAWVMEERSPPPPLELCSLAGLGCQLVTLSSKIWVWFVRLWGSGPGHSAERDKYTICFQFVLPILLSYLLRYTA